MPRPNFYSVVVTTLDGKIAKNKSHNVDWSSPEDKKHLEEMINRSDVVIVGHNTYDVAKSILSSEKLARRNYIIITHSVNTTEEKEKGRYIPSGKGDRSKDRKFFAAMEKMVGSIPER